MLIFAEGGTAEEPASSSDAVDSTVTLALRKESKQKTFFVCFE